MPFCRALDLSAVRNWCPWNNLLHELHARYAECMFRVTGIAGTSYAAKKYAGECVIHTLSCGEFLLQNANRKKRFSAVSSRGQQRHTTHLPLWVPPMIPVIRWI